MELASSSIFLTLGFYFFMTVCISWYFTKSFAATKESFLVANRQLGAFEGSVSIAATWLWVFALIMAPFFAYIKGLPGLIWFMVPNMAAIGILGFYAVKLLDMYPDGYTFSKFMRERHKSKRVQTLYQIQFLLLAVYAATMNFTAVGLVCGKASSVPVWQITGILAIGTIIYSWVGGLKSSVFSDKIQMIGIYIVTLIIVPWVIYSIGGIEVIAKGIGGKSGNFTEIFNWDIMLRPGLVVFLLLSAASFGDQSNYQRLFAFKNKKDVTKAFVMAGIIFGIVPIAFGLLGFAAAGMDIAGNPKVAYIVLLQQTLPEFAFCFFLFAILAALGSTLDSVMNAAGSVVANDWLKTDDEKKTIMASRMTMIVIAIIAWALSILQLDLWFPILIYGVLRCSTMMVDILSVFTKWITERGAFYGILSGIAIGLFINGYAIGAKQPSLELWGTLLAVVTPFIVCLAVSNVDRK